MQESIKPLGMTKAKGLAARLKRLLKKWWGNLAR